MQNNLKQDSHTYRPLINKNDMIGDCDKTHRLVRGRGGGKEAILH